MPTSTAMTSFPCVIAQHHEAARPPNARVVRRPRPEVGQDFFKHTNPANRKRVKCGVCPNQAFIPVSDEIIERHLRGDNGGRSSGDDFVAGVYPLLSDETCWFLAADFDKENWAADALAVLETCSAKGVPAALERSRSGSGGHIWIFFSEPVPARLARQLGALLITWSDVRRSASRRTIASFRAKM
jgi:hypothetical protein